MKKEFVYASTNLRIFDAELKQYQAKDIFKFLDCIMNLRLFPFVIPTICEIRKTF